MGVLFTWFKTFNCKSVLQSLTNCAGNKPIDGQRHECPGAGEHGGGFQHQVKVAGEATRGPATGKVDHHHWGNVEQDEYEVGKWQVEHHHVSVAQPCVVWLICSVMCVVCILCITLSSCTGWLSIVQKFISKRCEFLFVD